VTAPAPTLESRVRGLINLPTLPGVVRRIGSMATDAKSGAGEIAEAVSADQVLSAKVLRLVNSPVYGFPGRISSVTHAVVLLGFNVVKGLVLSSTMFSQSGRYGQGLFEHSLGCALLSRRIARELKMSDPEEVMMAGLLHDLGKVVLCYLGQEQYAKVVEVAIDQSCHVAEAERTEYGVDHTRVALWLAQEWHFPNRIWEPMTYHHRPETAKESKATTAVVHVADILTRGMGYGFPGDECMPTLNHAAYSSLNLSFEQIDSMLGDVEAEFAMGSGVFTGD
jgi:putative nucleotidyltransferase with HDIG domain